MLINGNIESIHEGKYKPMDVLFMSLIALKLGGAEAGPLKCYKSRAELLKERNIVYSIRFLALHVDAIFIEYNKEANKMTILMEQKSVFKTFNFALERTIVRFQGRTVRQGTCTKEVVLFRKHNFTLFIVGCLLSLMYLLPHMADIIQSPFSTSI